MAGVGRRRWSAPWGLGLISWRLQLKFLGSNNSISCELEWMGSGFVIAVAWGWVIIYDSRDVRQWSAAGVHMHRVSRAWFEGLELGVWWRRVCLEFLSVMGSCKYRGRLGVEEQFVYLGDDRVIYVLVWGFRDVIWFLWNGGSCVATQLWN
jgi:hypothetical protein